MVATDGLALEARRLHAALAERADAVISLEQRRARLSASLQLRLRAIQARTWRLRVQCAYQCCSLESAARAWRPRCRCAFAPSRRAPGPVMCRKSVSATRWSCAAHHPSKHWGGGGGGGAVLCRIIVSLGTNTA